MGKFIRRTLTITETWTLIWMPGGDHAVGAKRHPVPYPPAVGSDLTNPEQPDETLQTTLNLAEPSSLPHAGRCR